jgi:hypothetical protein
VRAAALAAVAAVVVLSACSGSTSSTPEADPTPVLSSPTTAPTTPPPAPDPPPPARACYRLGYDDALAPTTTKGPVPCTGRHTAVGFYVGAFPRHLPVDGRQVHRLVSTQCPKEFASFAGGTTEDRRLSLLRTVWFTPTVEQSDLGARWFSCVAIALRDDRHLAVLTTPVARALDTTSGRAQYGLCGTAQPGTTGFQQRICSVPHSWRALSTVDFSPGAYPGESTVRDAGQSTCQDAARAVADDPLNYQWSYQWPTLAQWRAGQTYGVCWAPS